MDQNSKGLLKYLVGMVLGGIVLVVGYGMSTSNPVRAQDEGTATPAGVGSITDTPLDTSVSVLAASETPFPTGTTTSTPVPGVTSTPEGNGYFSVQDLSLSNEPVVQEIIIHGPPVPPPGFEIQRQSVSVPDILSAAGSKILIVPAYPWVYGCSAVSGAMIAAYYDRNGYSNIYTGPTNGGVMPLVDDPTWGTWVDNPPSPAGSFTYYNNPLVATKLGMDGWTIRGSIDDYWVQYGSAAPDPYIPGSWTQHAWGAAIGDYMHTSQSHYNGSTTYGLADAYTRFYDNFSTPSAPLLCSTLQYYVTLGYPPDGTLGRKQFYEAKGYTVTDCYTQYTDNQYAGGFSYAQYKAEIDAGRPVMINLTGHTIVGVGYADPNTVYIHDTWDSGTHTMTWGGSYSGMAMVAVSIVNLAPVNSTILNVTLAGTGSGTVTSSPVGINCGTTCSYAFNTGSSVVLTAATSGSSIFTGWSGGGCSGIGTCTVTMSFVQTVTATFSLPDLSITSLTLLPTSPFTTDDITVTAHVANTGLADAFTFRIEFYVDDSWQSCGYLGASPQYYVRAGGLAASSTGIWSVTIPKRALSVGTHTISAYVDMGCEVTEVNEANNNSGLVSVTVSIPLPGAFNLSSPANAAINQPINPTLSWGASNDATSYEYCLDTTNDNACNAAWISTTASNSIALSGLIPGTTYYWQVRARNSTGMTYANGGSTAWFSFIVSQVGWQIFRVYLPLVTSGH